MKESALAGVQINGVEVDKDNPKYEKAQSLADKINNLLNEHNIPEAVDIHCDVYETEQGSTCKVTLVEGKLEYQATGKYMDECVLAAIKLYKKG